MQNAAINMTCNDPDELSSGQELLYGQYVIESHLCDGGFGMTYLAKDSLDRRVVIKECFPSTLCRRINGEVRPRKPSYQEQYHAITRCFVREALRMAKLDHPNIVKVHQVFQENNTAYIAMDYIDGMDLLSVLDHDPGRLKGGLVETLLRDTLDALAHVHGMGMLHRDISPENLLLDARGKLTLIDFGAAREDAARHTRALSTVMSVKDGYSPHEFYYNDGKQLPSSDIYSVGATFYHLIAGFPPPDCQKRVAALVSGRPDPLIPLSGGNWPFEQSLLRVIDKALSIPQEERFQSVEEWLDTLDHPWVAPAEPQVPGPSDAAEAASDPRGAGTSSASEIDPGTETDLVEKIVALVKNTNRDLEQGKPGKLKQHQHIEVVAKEAVRPKVDIFGNPIDDVETWLKEHDNVPQSDPDPIQGEVRDAPPTKESQNDTGSERRLFPVLTRFTRKRKRSMALFQN